MRSSRRVLALATLVALHGGVAKAQQTAAPERTLDAASRRALVDSAARLLERYYVFADTGQMLASHLRRRLAEGAFDRATGEVAFGEQLTRELQAVNHDGHLYTSWRPAPGTPAAATLAMWRQNTGTRAVAGAPMRRTASPDEITALRRRNFYLNRVDRLEGNVGYLEVLGLNASPEAYRALDAAMAFLGRVDALIVDVRKAPGGDQMTNYLSSWFLPDSTPLVWNANRMMNDTLRNRAGQVGGEKRLDIPVYVLTSGRTASAAEAFAFTLQSNRRARVVGTRSAGAGYNNMFFPLSDDLGMSISIGRGFFPATGAGWEGTGVIPDLEVPAEQALAAAHAEALGALAAAETDPRRKQELEWTRGWVDAGLHPVTVPAATLASYAGSYGNRVVTVAGGELVYQRRADRPGDPLRALSATEFAPSPEERLEFVRDASGAVSALRIHAADGTVSTVARTAAR